MEIANLLKQKPTPEAPEVFLAVQIQEGLVKTALWQIAEGQPQVLSFGTLQTYTDVDSLPEVVDTSLTHALANLDSEPNRVLFGIPETWIKDNQLSPENKDLITSVTKELDLKPVGFVSITDSLITYLKEKEGIPPSIILVEVADTKVNVVVSRLGQIKGREEVDRSSDIAADVAEGLARIATDQLPSRFLVINGTDPEIEQQLISYPWTDKFPFLHLPKVEVPDPHFSIEAIAVSGGTEAARSLGFEVTESGEVEPNQPINESTNQPFSSFVEPEITGLPAQPAELAAGFVVDQDVADTVTPVDTVLPTKPKFTLPRFFLPKFQFRLPPLPQFSPFGNKKIIILVPVILLLLISGLYAFVLLVLNSAQVQVQVDPYLLSKSLPITIGGQAADSLTASPQTFSIEKSANYATTGEATVGDHAKGQIVIFNKTDIPKTLPKGTVLTTTNNLKFTLDDSVTIASRSASSNIDINTGTQTINLGHSTAAVTASKIGTESNLASNTSLSVANFPLSTTEAKVSSELTGGTSRTVRAVSADDQKQLLSNVLDQIKQEAQTKVSASGTQEAVPTTDIKVTKQAFNKGVGEEADSISLTVTATITVLKYNQADLLSLVAKQLTNDIPAGYQFSPDNLTVSLKDTSVSSTGQITATALVEGKLLPQLDLNQYQNLIKGKSVLAARQLFETVSGFQGINFKLTYRLPLMADRLPYNAQKIHLSITSTK